VDWHDAARQLANRLSASGELNDPAWRTAFTDTPRHMFVPGFSLDEAYADQALVTQQHTAAVTGGDRVQLPTSSASQPGVVATMLERLDINSGMRVLEIGTGTGYNAALLCHRFGDANVYSVDLDPQLVAQAGHVLAGVGYRPQLRAADGTDGWPEEGPFHRIIATCAIDHIPPAWINQLVPSGRIVAPLLGDECALMVLDKTADDEVTGRFDQYRTAFMPMRPDVDNPLPGGRTFGLATHGIGQYGTTGLDPSAFDHTDTDLILLLHLHLPGLSIGSSEGPDGKFLTLSTPAGAAQVALVADGQDGRFTTIQHNTRLWDTAEHVAGLWERLGRPGRSRYGISALNRADRQYVWLDHPDSRYAWALPL
jgi:protein-L-isoaspartate(D-aspartate) O-methyltransferase